MNHGLEMAVDTRKVEGRRTLRFESLDEMLAEAERLATIEVRTLGNWSLGQIFMHLAMVQSFSIDGYPWVAPRPLRFVLKMLLKNRFLKRGFPPSGKRMRLPKKALSMFPGETGVAEGIEALREATARVKGENKRAVNPMFGKLSLADWNKLYLRHAELHLSFVLPAELIQK